MPSDGFSFASQQHPHQQQPTMSTAAHSHAHAHAHGHVSPTHLVAGSSALVNPKLRKRTKTGCLTCRKRRIKCGEERPTCNNCIKSKRHCEGYNQRVIWKPPIGDLSGVYPASSALPFATPLFATHPGLVRPVPPPILTHDAALAQIQPRIYGNGYDEPQTAYDVHSAGGNGLTFNGARSAPPFPSQNPFGPQSYTPISPPQGSAYGLHHLPQPNGQINGQQYPLPQLHTPPHVDPSALPPPPPPPPQQHQQQQHYQPTAAFDQSWSQHQPVFPPTPVSIPPEYKSSLAECSLPTPAPTLISGSSERLSFNKPEDSKPNFWEPIVNRQQTQQTPQENGASLPYTDVKPLWRRGSLIRTPPRQTQVEPTHHNREEPVFGKLNGHCVSPTQLLDEAAVEYEDDDYFDVQSDEEVDVPPSQAVVTAFEAKRDFGMILALHRETTNEWSMRRYDNFIYDGILDKYHAEWVASPLKNPKTARVFAHFISATGPTLSIFERAPRNTSAIFDDPLSSSSQHGLWTYTLPMMALNHQGLLHAMLALSSLHIAKLQGASITPSFKHYAYSLKRLRHCLGHPKKRHLPTTFAATLLLGFYEVMTADHLKWSSHLLGAKQLLIEMDFRLMTKEARRLKAIERGADQFSGGMLDEPFALNPVSAMQDSTVVDENIVSAITGQKIRYDEFGQVLGEGAAQKRPSPMPEPFDVSRYELYQDLFWWYAKQDVYQSIVGANGLLLDYTRWADYPPRAALNRPDAIYGTCDHIMLLLGRVADFQHRDRSRKVRYVDANGGQWRPPAGFQFGANPGGPPPPPQFNQQGSSSTSPPQPQGPTFFGMAPIPQQRRMPSSFRSDQPYYRSASPPTPKSEVDFNTATASAIDEWNQIRSALEIFSSSLGPAFQPLSAEYNHQPAFDSPFGGVLQYRSYDIAVIWGMYYMTNIILLRSHPHMPPASMVAAGIAAPQTAQYAQLIGQIGYGLAPTPRGQPLNPSLGAALCEICMPLFFAGVQYRDAAQREWLTTRVRDIERRTGWASVGMIAHGCETAWEKAAEAGRGPPYQRRRVDHIEYLSGDDRLRKRGAAHHFEQADPTIKDLTDKRYIHVHPATRVHWAMGLLSLEEDVERQPAMGEGQAQQQQPQVV